MIAFICSRDIAIFHTKQTKSMENFFLASLLLMLGTRIWLLLGRVKHPLFPIEQMETWCPIQISGKHWANY